MKLGTLFSLILIPFTSIAIRGFQPTIIGTINITNNYSSPVQVQITDSKGMLYNTNLTGSSDAIVQYFNSLHNGNSFFQFNQSIQPNQPYYLPALNNQFNAPNSQNFSFLVQTFVGNTQTEEGALAVARDLLKETGCVAELTLEVQDMNSKNTLCTIKYRVIVPTEGFTTFPFFVNGVLASLEGSYENGDVSKGSLPSMVTGSHCQIVENISNPNINPYAANYTNGNIPFDPYKLNVLIS